jgi:DNA topoisomerase-1
MPWEKVAATVVRLLDLTLVRIGSTEYARENGSYGLTTLCKKHLEIEADRLRFKFRGKSGVEHDVDVDDPRVARIVRRCMDLPGRALFQYVDEDGHRHTIGSSDINDYLRAASGADFTAKDYRTWAGSVFALAALRRVEPASAAQVRKRLVDAVKDVAAILRNTPAVCRRCYVHPAVIAAFEAGELGRLPPSRARHGLKTDEAAFAALLRREARRSRANGKCASANGAKTNGAKLRTGTPDARADPRLVRLLAKSRDVRRRSAAATR